MKIKFTAEQKKVLAEKMKEARKYAGSERDMFIARTIGDVYDVELPIPEVIESISRTERAGVGEHVYYNAPASITKKVNTLTSDCAVTQTKVTPNTRTEVDWTDLASEEVYVCLHEWLKADHNVLQFNAEAISEAMDRAEIYGVLSLVDAGATSEGNLFTESSGSNGKFTYPDLVAMARSVAKYGRELVLITGGNVTTDVQLLNYDADKNQAVSIFDVVTKHIPIEELAVTIGGSPTTVISADVAYLVAVADAKNNRSLIFARRQTTDLNDMIDTQAMDANKERVVVSSGNGMNVGSARKLAKGFVGFEEYSATSINDKVFAKYTRS
jgi:hypothetical protein